MNDDIDGRAENNTDGFGGKRVLSAPLPLQNNSNSGSENFRHSEIQQQNLQQQYIFENGINAGLGNDNLSTDGFEMYDEAYVEENGTDHSSIQISPWNDMTQMNGDGGDAPEQGLDDDIEWLIGTTAKMLKEAPSSPLPSRSKASSPVLNRSPVGSLDRFKGENLENSDVVMPEVAAIAPLQLPPRSRTAPAAGKQRSKPLHQDLLAPKPIKKIIDDNDGFDGVSMKYLLSQSTPAFKPVSSLAPSQTESKKSKKSVMGLTKELFDADSTASPYLEHLKKSNPLFGMTNVLDIHKAVFKKNDKKKKKNHPASAMSKSPLPVIPQDKRLNSNTALVSQDFKPMTPMLPPASRGGLESRGGRTDPLFMNRDLYERSKILMEQIKGRPATSAPRQSTHPADGPDDRAEKNMMNMIPASSNAIRVRSSFNNIDDLITEQFVPIYKPATKSSGSRINDRFLSSTSATAGNGNTASNKLEAENRLDAMDMLANIHIDPLYRIIREEMDRVQLSRSIFSSGVGQKAFVKFAEPIKSSELKILSYFNSLPPSVWVTSRLVYFILISYYETVIRKPEFQAFREITHLEQLWEILERQYDKESMSSNNVIRIFSWCYLQELLQFPTLLCRALDIIENGMSMSATQWDHFHAKCTAQKGIYYTEIEPNKGLNDIYDEETSRSLYFDLFPVASFQPLREMVKAARGFLLTSSSMLFGSAAMGCPLVPGSPLAISVSLTAWVKRVIALLYISGTQRVRVGRTSAAAAGEMINDVAAATTAGMDNTTDQKRPQTANNSGSVTLPPNLSFTCIVDAKEGPYSAHHELCQTCTQYFYHASSIVRPSDQLEVMICASQSNDRSVQDFQALKQSLELHLRVTTASPLHKVITIFDQQHNDKDNALPQDSHQDIALHPALRYMMVSKDSAAVTEGDEHENKPPAAAADRRAADILLTELWMLNGVEPLIDGSKLVNTEAIEKIKENITYSLALVNGMPSSQGSPPHHNSLLRSNRYVIAVTDTVHSWNAFQLAIRLAKESDIVMILHIPTIKLTDLPTSTSSLCSLTYQQYQYLLDLAIKRKLRVISFYKKLGYNVYCTQLPSYLDMIKRVLENYSESLHYKLDSLQVLGPELGYHPLTSYECYGSNEEYRVLCRNILTAVLKLQADYLLVGADASDIFNGLSCKYLNDFWGFRAMPSATEKAISILEQEKNANIPYQDFSSNVSGEEYQEDFALFEEKGVVFSAMTAVEPAGGDGDSYDEGFEGESEPEVNKKNIEPNREVISIKPTQTAAAGGTISIGNDDYELDSFIVEDEGDHSLTASPLGHASSGGFNLRSDYGNVEDREGGGGGYMNDGSIASSWVPSATGDDGAIIVTPRQLAHLQQFRDYSRNNVNLVDMLLHEATVMDEWLPKPEEIVQQDELTVYHAMPGILGGSLINLSNSLSVDRRSGGLSFILANTPPGPSSAITSSRHSSKNPATTSPDNLAL